MLDYLKNIFNRNTQAMPPLQPVSQTIQQRAIDEVLAGYLDRIKSNQIPYAQGVVNKMGADNIVQGIQQGLNFGIPQIADWQSQYNSGAGRANPINIPRSGQEVQLAQENKFNSLSGLNGGVADVLPPPQVGVWNKFLDGMQDLQSGFKENVSTPFSVDNLRANEGKKPMNRAGEVLGTMGRFSNSPLGRGVIVGGLVGATGGSPLQSLAYGGQATLGNQSNRMKNDLYRQQMGELGYSPEQVDSLGSYVDSDTFKNLADSRYKMQFNGYRNRKLDQDSYVKIKKMYDTQLEKNVITPQDYLLALKELNNKLIDDNITTVAPSSVQRSNDTLKTGSMININEKRGKYLDVQSREASKRTGIMATNASANMIRATNAKNDVKNAVSGTKGNGKNDPFYGSHMAEYLKITERGTPSQRAYARQNFMSRYGEDPDKALKAPDTLQQILNEGK